MRATLVRLVAIVALGSIGVAAAGRDAKGTVGYKNRSGAYTLTVRHAYVVTGPAVGDPASTVVRLIFSAEDLGGAIQSCASMMCVDGRISDALVIDVTDGPRLTSWLTLNKGRVQYSGPQAADALAITSDTPTRLAGRLAFDATTAGGPRVDVTFDAAVIKEF
jgi:hypothetical protein